MKKIFTFLCAAVIAVSAFAQWTKPVPSTTQEMLTDGTAQFMYNQEAVGFFAGANEWSTRASIDSRADSVRFVSVGEGYYNFCCYPSSKSEWRYVSCGGFESMWVDAPNQASNESYPGTDQWLAQKNANGSYSFHNAAYDSSYDFGITEYFKGAAGDTRCYINDPDEIYQVSEDDYAATFSGSFYSQWYFIDSTEYKSLQPKVIVYMAAMKLDAALKNAKKADATHDYSAIEAVYNNISSTEEELLAARDIVNALISFKAAYDKDIAQYPDLDFSAPKAVYDNPNSSAEELAAAEKALGEIINMYLGDLATFDSPVDFTSTIGDGSALGNWTRTFTASGTNGTHHLNTWSTEADNGADGTDMTTPFIEDWISSGSILSDQKISQTINVPAGLYKLTADVRVYSEAGKLDSFNGAKMFMGNDTIDLQDGQTVTYSGSKSVLWNKDYYSVIAVVRESGEVELGFNVVGANFNWIAFKNTSLTYYGNNDVDANAVKLYKQMNTFEPITEADAQPELITAYNEALEAYNSAQTLDEVKTANANMQSAQAALQANIKAYATLLDKINTWSSHIAEKQDLEGEEWDKFCDFLQFTDPIDGYPAPTAAAIVEGNRSLSTAEISEYITKVDELYAYAVAHSIVVGTDCTDMLVNPSFSDGFNGWTYANGNVGGIDICKNVEVYSNVVNISQTVNDVPNGIYSLSCQAFERPEENGGYTGDEIAKVYLFMNDFQTPVMNITKDVVTEENAVNKENCYIDNGGTAVGTWPLDYLVAGGYVPNSMDGASYAFSAGRYRQKVYGFINNGQMNIGLTSNGEKVNWVLWANFRLTYEGRSEEAIDAILPQSVSSLDTYLMNHEVTDPVKAEATAAIAYAGTLDMSSDYTEKYNALVSISDEFTAVKENAALVDTYFNTYVDAMQKYDAASPEGQAAFDAISGELIDYSICTTAELQVLYEKLLAVLAQLAPLSGEEELATPDADKAVVTGTCYTAGSYGEFTNSRNGSGYLKVRTGQNGSTMTFNVNEGYVITGISITGYSNNTSTTGDRSIYLTGIYIDENDSSVLTETHTFNGGTAGQDPTTCAVSGFEASKSVVLKFDNSNIVSSDVDSKGKNKQLQAIITLTFARATNIKDAKTAIPAAQTAIFNLSGQRVSTMRSGNIYIINGRKVLVK